MGTLEEAYEDEYKYRREYDEQLNIKRSVSNETFIPPKPKVSSGTINPTYTVESPLVSDRDLFYNPVTNPAHYVEGRKYEPIEVIEDWKLGFLLGNALKYIARAERKGNKQQDLAKAVWYLQREIGRK